MALTKQIEVQDGLGNMVDFEAYIKVSYVSTAKETGSFQISYINKNNGLVVKEEDILFSPDFSDTGLNIWKQAYEHLKTLPEFADAVDC